MSQQPSLIAFTHIAKTAGTTLHHVLRRTYGAGYVQVKKRYASGPPLDAHDLGRLRCRYRNLRALGGHPVLPHGDLVRRHPEIRFLTMIQDPSRRCASQYAHYVGQRGREPFHDWIQNEFWHDHQTVRLAGVADADEAVRVLNDRFLFVGVIEKFDESLRLLGRYLPELAAPPREVHRNVSRKLCEGRATGRPRSLGGDGQHSPRRRTTVQPCSGNDMADATSQQMLPPGRHLPRTEELPPEQS